MMKDEELREMLDRIRRIETRLMTLGVRLGYNLKEEESIHVDAATRIVTLDNMDVSVSEVIKAARRAGLHGKKVTVLHIDEIVTENFYV